MNAPKRIPITKDGFERLKKDLKDLKDQRPQAVKTLSEARSMGDLSENGLYTAAKARLRSIDNQIFRLDIQIKLADIIEGGKTNTVGIGNSVVLKTGEIQKTYHVVGDYEANPLELKISQHSPIGRALMGKKEGDEIVVETPAGITKYFVLKVEASA